MIYTTIATPASILALAGCSSQEIENIDRCVTMSLGEGPAYLLCTIAEKTGAEWVGALAVFLGFVTAVAAWNGHSRNGVDPGSNEGTSDGEE